MAQRGRNGAVTDGQSLRGSEAKPQQKACQVGLIGDFLHQQGDESRRPFPGRELRSNGFGQLLGALDGRHGVDDQLPFGQLLVEGLRQEPFYRG